MLRDFSINAIIVIKAAARRRFINKQSDLIDNYGNKCYKNNKCYYTFHSSISCKTVCWQT